MVSRHRHCILPSVLFLPLSNMFPLVSDPFSLSLVLPKPITLLVHEWCRNESVTLCNSGQWDIKDESIWGFLGKVCLFMEKRHLGRYWQVCLWCLELDRVNINNEDSRAEKLLIFLFYSLKYLLFFFFNWLTWGSILKGSILDKEISHSFPGSSIVPGEFQPWLTSGGCLLTASGTRGWACYACG